MKIYWKDELVAYQVGMSMIRCDVPIEKLPFGLFSDKQEISIDDAYRWADRRCFPSDRVDAKQLLTELNLSMYRNFLISTRTGAALYGNDCFWVDYETDESVHSYGEYFGE